MCFTLSLTDKVKNLNFVEPELKSLLSVFLLMMHEKRPEMSLDDVRPPHVADPEEEVEVAGDVPDHGRLGEGNGVRSFLVNPMKMMIYFNSFCTQMMLR
jgi:hypothetical protein